MAILEGDDRGLSQSDDVVSEDDDDDDDEDDDEDDDDDDDEDDDDDDNGSDIDDVIADDRGHLAPQVVAPVPPLMLKPTPAPISIPPPSPIPSAPPTDPLPSSSASALSMSSSGTGTPLPSSSLLAAGSTPTVSSLELEEDILEVWAAVTEGSKYLIACALLAVVQRTTTAAASPMIRLLIRRGHTCVWMRKAITFKYIPATTALEVLGPSSAAVLVFSACAVEIGFQFMSSLCAHVRKGWQGLIIDGMPPPSCDELAEIVAGCVLANIDTLPRVLRGMLHVTNSTMARKYPKFGSAPGGLLLFEYFVVPALR